jgi:hypothetical protein
MTLSPAPAANTVPESRQESLVIASDGEQMPPFVEQALQRLYGNIHSSLAHLRVYGGIEGITNVYVARRQSEITAILLYRVDGDAVQVVNEGMLLDEEEIERFAAHVFSTLPQVATISFHAVQADIRRLRFPYQQHVCTANIVLALPPTQEAYLASLGKNTRRNIRRYMEKLMRDFPGFRYEVYEKEEVDPQQVREIMNLNRARISGKNKIYSIDNEEDMIVALTRACGMVGVATIDGRVCGGAVGYRVGNNYFFKVIAHDPRYNAYSAGILCCYLTICACIERGCKEYNFMWNEYEYKFALGAVRRDLHHIAVYRSRLQYLRHAGTVCGNVLAACRYQAALLIERGERPEQLSRIDRIMLRLLAGARWIRRAL